MKYILFIAFVICVLSVSCNNTKHRTFSELDKRIQDTLLKQNSDIYGCYPDLIDFTGSYKIIHKTFGPWTYKLTVLNVVTGKSYKGGKTKCVKIGNGGNGVNGCVIEG